MRIAFKIVRKMLVTRVAVAAGSAAAMYLADPQQGRSRRARLTAQGGAMMRRTLRQATRGARSEERRLMGRLDGVMSGAMGRGHYHPESDVDLREHLRQVLHSLRIDGLQVNVDVNGGVAALRGQIPDEEIRSTVLHAVNQVEGVTKVEDYMHLPGQVPPNKASALGL